jgi:hypothetical protein
MKRLYLCIVLVLVLLFSLLGCAPSFRPLEIDSKTGGFKSWGTVKPEDIKEYKLYPGIKNIKFVYLRTKYPSDNDHFYSYLANGLRTIGVKNVLNESELSNYVLSNGLSSYVTSISDPISLHKLSELVGPFLYMDADLDIIRDCTFKFVLKVINPAKNEGLLEVSRIELNDLDLDNEVNRPMLNLIKKWYDESAEFEPPAIDSKSTL